MPKKKCPACGSTDTVKILYGEPTYEAYEASTHGKAVLGGCLISSVSPTKHCKACGQDFGGKDLIPLYEMTSFEFFVGGYFGTSHFVYIDGKRKNKLIRYTKTPGGMCADLKHPKNDINFHPDILLKEIPLTSEQWLAFIEELVTLEIARWKDEYCDSGVCDGTQWELMIRLPNRNKIIRSGSNEYPPYWNKCMKIMKKYIGEMIG